MDYKSIEALIRYVPDAPLLPEQHRSNLCGRRSGLSTRPRLVGHSLHRRTDVLMLCHHHKTNLVRAGQQMDYRIEREKQTVRRMIELYCRHHLKQDTMPDEYQHLAEFACRRLDHCKYGENKTACKDCPTHCYAPKEREQIRKIMRWAGPRMIFYSPIDAIRHLFNI